MTLETKSPFPGCDPYLQRRWESCHVDMITALRDQMRGRLPAGLRSRIESRIYLEETDPDGRVKRSNVKPDAIILEHAGHRPRPGAETAGSWSGANDQEADTLVAEPLNFETIPVEMKERYIDIVDVNDGGRIVTSIEVLSPANKYSPGFEMFRKKQDTMRDGGVNLLEIDLIRGGARAISAPAQLQDAAPDILFRVVLLPAWKSSGTLYALTLRHRLPVVDLPLRKTDPPLSLDLQMMHDIAYDRGEFAIDVDYRKEPDPPLPAPDAAWADAMLKRKGLR
ncbi:MAG: DUF4058 family protein [Verrucomicrobiaceae bacterium]|nr:DUF4058 family protein [Verrucomicrobiaceae bacterium]